MNIVNLQHILVPTDFSKESHRAIQYAKALAELFGAKITLLHIIVPLATPDLVYGPVAWDVAKVEESANKHLEELKSSFEFTSAVELDCLVKEGHPLQEISGTAKELNTDLIIVATHGYTGFKHMLLGSVAEKVIRHAACPVLVVREKEHEFISLEHHD